MPCPQWDLRGEPAPGMAANGGRSYCELDGTVKRTTRVIEEEEEFLTVTRSGEKEPKLGTRQEEPFHPPLPVAFRYVPGQPKRILRALLARYVPPTIWNGPKHGFDFPLHEFLAAENFALVRRYLNGSSLSASAALHPGQLEGFSKQFMAGDQRLTFRIWALVVLSAWLEHHGNPL